MPDADPSAGDTGRMGSDQFTFDRAKLPSVIFMQDPLFGARHYHSNMDVADYVMADDLKQSAALVAWVLYRASNEN